MPNSPIHESVKFGENVRLGYYVVIEEGCEIGDNCFIGNFVMMRPYTKIGNNCVIGHGCVFEGWSEIGDGTHIMPQCHITKGAKIGRLVFIGAGVIGVNDRKMVFRRKEFKPEPFEIRDYARIGSGAIILSGVVIEENALVGAGAIVTKNVPAGKIAIGIPARIIGDVLKEEWIS